MMSFPPLSPAMLNAATSVAETWAMRIFIYVFFGVDKREASSK